MLSRIIKSNRMTPHVPSPTRHGKRPCKRFTLHVFILGNYGKAMVQRQSIKSMEVHPQTLILRLPKRKIRMEIDKATNHIKKLKARRDSLPDRLTVADAQRARRW